MPTRAYAPQTAHILRDWLNSSRVDTYDSPGSIWFTEENHECRVPHSAQPTGRSFHCQTFQKAEGPATSASTFTPSARYHRYRPLCGLLRRAVVAICNNFCSLMFVLYETC